MHIFVTGGTGLVGNRLIETLLKRGDSVSMLTRRPEVAKAKWGERCTIVPGDPAKAGPWMDAVKECDGVVNLAGEGIFNRRWSDDFKKQMYDSRILGTQNVVKALTDHPTRADGSPKVLVNASAIGYYGPHGDEELTEASPPADDYLAKLCVDWEKAANEAAKAGVRVALIRIGVVLDPAGGALQKLLPPFKMFAGGPIGSGKHFMSWIHADDLVGLTVFALERPNVQGPINATAPHPVTNKQFGNTLGKVLGRPSFMPTPAFMLRLMLGEVANVVTKGQNVLPRKALEAGYVFQYADLEGALKQLLAK
jgi:uncharacterized protein (TIGR01777 family)